MSGPEKFEGRLPSEWVTDIEILIGSGETARAEAILLHLCAIEVDQAANSSESPAPWYFDKLAALINGRGDRASAIAILERYVGLAKEPGYLGDELARLRAGETRPFKWTEEQLAVDDERFRTQNGTFYRPLPVPATGNVRFVFVGGPMHYVDRRGDHACVSGSDIEGTEDEKTAEEVARVASMTDSEQWIDSAVRLIDRLLKGAQRTGDDDAWCLSVSFVTGGIRDSVRAVLGRPPVRVQDGPPRLAKPARGRWLYFREGRPSSGSIGPARTSITDSDPTD